jgi:uncharacterized protein YcsI (UPF0317 family)
MGVDSSIADAAASTLADARARIRDNVHTGPTSGLAAGFAQANLVILPAEHAVDFARFCVRNPKPCPLLDITDAGSPHPVSVAPDADLRTDLPRYLVYRNGSLVDEPTEIGPYWRDDLVGFLLGCSFTFEWALSAAGLPLAHQRQGVNVPMYVTNRGCTPAGPFAGRLVVSMRPFKERDIARAAEISSRFPAMHGGPVHVGNPAALGVTDLADPDFGDPVAIQPDEVPVFWACGVTPQAVVVDAKISLAIFHAPGHMFITDRPHSEFDSQETSS